MLVGLHQGDLVPPLGLAGLDAEQERQKVVLDRPLPGAALRQLMDAEQLALRAVFVEERAGAQEALVNLRVGLLFHVQVGPAGPLELGPAAVFLWGFAWDERIGLGADALGVE